MQTDYDYAIVGAGCAGLSLAAELAQTVSDRRRIALIDPRQDYRLDRIWCFWKTMPHRFATAVRHEWHRWTVRYDQKEVTRVSARYPYQYVPADAFYKAAFDRIDRHPGVDLRLETTAEAIVESGDHAVISTNQGDLRARIVFDGRNRGENHLQRDCLLQHYLGQQVRTAEPVFTPGTVTLMDFDVNQRHGIAFVYVLPFSAHEALVEPTVFSRAPLRSDVYVETIRDYMQDRFGVRAYQVRFQEQGIIPMSTASPAPPTARIVPIGTAAGRVRGSTGYGFLPIQKHSREVAGDVAAGRIERRRPARSQWTGFLDRVFLDYLEGHPRDAPGMFFNLFERVAADRLVRFLSERARPADTAAVVAAMPKAPFLRAAVHDLATRGATR
jgi:lycopene beta-cyclase